VKNKSPNLFQSFCGWVNLPGYCVISFSLILIIFLIFDWLVATSLRAAKIDHYILFSLAETSRLFYAKTALHNPFVFLNPNAKPIYSIISAMFIFIFPLGLFSLKVLNSLLSIGTLVILYKLIRKMGYGDFVATIAIILTLTFPLFFLLSISALTEILFCFFLTLAFYCFYLKRYFSSVLLISLLPLIRQEGALYIFIMLFLLLKEKKIYYAFILPIPLLVWILLNFFLLEHSFIYPLFVCVDLPGPTAKSDIMSLAELKNFLPAIFCHPLFFLFPIGFILAISKKHYLPIIISLICQSLFFIIAAIIQFLITKQVSYAFRYIVPLIPFMALITAGIFNNLVLGKKSKIIVVVFMSIVLIGILINRITALQKHPRVVAESITEKQERAIEEAVVWLKAFIKETGIQYIFYSGDMTDNKMIRRLKTYLVDSIAMYPVKEFREVYDPVTFKIIEREFRNSTLTGLVLLLDPEREKDFILSKKIESLKNFPDIPVYLYRKY
jgi:hypothetical protein